MDTHFGPSSRARNSPRLARYGLLSLLAAAPAYAAHLELQIDGVEGPLRDAAVAAAGMQEYSSRDVTAAQADRKSVV